MVIALSVLCINLSTEWYETKVIMNTPIDSVMLNLKWPKGETQQTENEPKFHTSLFNPTALNNEKDQSVQNDMT